MSTATAEPKAARREAYKWPDWIKQGSYISQDKNGDLWLHENRPYMSGDGWSSDGDLIWLESPMIDFERPVFRHWAEQPIRKPFD